jgi:lysophospholipase L1-like esterase
MPLYKKRLNYQTYNFGVGGDNTSDILARMTPILAVGATLAILNPGVNDWRNTSSSKRRTPAQYKANYISIIQQLKAAGHQVIVLNIPPILEAESDYVCPFYGQASGCNVNATGDAFRVAANEAAVAESVHWIDTYTLFTSIGQPTTLASSYIENTANSGSTDGVHLRPDGAELEATAINTYIRANGLLTASLKTICIGDSNIYGDGLIGGGTATGETVPARLRVKLNSGQ